MFLCIHTFSISVKHVLLNPTFHPTFTYHHRSRSLSCLLCGAKRGNILQLECDEDIRPVTGEEEDKYNVREVPV